MNEVSQNKSVARPKWTESMALEIAPIVAEYLEITEPDDDDLKRIAKVLNRHKNDDGFELGKAFDRDGFSVDFNVCENLDNVSCLVSEVIEKHVKKWVSDNNIQPVYKTGDPVTLSRPIDKETAGVVFAVRHDVAEYEVQTPSCRPTQRYIIKYEDINTNH